MIILNYILSMDDEYSNIQSRSHFLYHKVPEILKPECIIQ